MRLNMRRKNTKFSPSDKAYEPGKSSGYTYVVREKGARMIFLQGAPRFKVTPLRSALFLCTINLRKEEGLFK